MAFDGPGFHVEIEVLGEVSQAMDEIARKQRDFELDDLSGEAQMYGHDGLQEAFEEFCDRYDESVRMLCDKVDDMKDGLAATSKAYREAEQSNVKILNDPGLRAVEDN